MCKPVTRNLNITWEAKKQFTNGILMTLSSHGYLLLVVVVVVRVLPCVHNITSLHWCTVLMIQYNILILDHRAHQIHWFTALQRSRSNFNSFLNIPKVLHYKSQHTRSACYTALVITILHLLTILHPLTLNPIYWTFLKCINADVTTRKQNLALSVPWHGL